MQPKIKNETFATQCNPYQNMRYNSVGVTGFEPAASSSRTKRSTKLSHTPFKEHFKYTGEECQQYFSENLLHIKRGTC